MELSEFKKGDTMNKIVYIFVGLFVIITAGFSEQIDSGRVYIQQANNALSKKNYQTAIDNYKAGLRFRPDNGAVVYNIACSYSLLDNKKEALKWVKKMVELGVYKFEDDEDFNNIRDTKEFKNLVAKAKKLLGELKTTVFEPVISLPDGFDSSKTYPLLIGLHGYGSNPVDFSKALKNIPNKINYILCCPYGPDIMGKVSFGWGEKVDAEKRILDDIEFVKKKFKIDSAKVILLGFSQGGGVAYYMGLKHAELFKGIIPAAGGYDSTFNLFLANAKGKKIKFFIMLGEDEDERRITANIEAVELLVKNSITVSFNGYAGYGHTMPGDVDYEVERAIKWIEKE